MANANFAFGLKPVRDAHTSNHTNALTPYAVPASYATALFIGDPVIKVAAGSQADGRHVSLPLCHAAANGGAITGVVMGFEDINSMTLGYGAASTERVVLVDDNPDSLYEVQEDAVGGALAAADVGLNADLISAAGSTATRTSGWMLDTSTKATTATLQVKIMGFQRRIDNEPGNANAKVLVKINNHTQQTATAGI